MAWERGYFSQAGRLLLRGARWLRPLLCALLTVAAYGFALATCLVLSRSLPMARNWALSIPLVSLAVLPALFSSFAIAGYMLEYSRLLAFGSDMEPHQTDMTLGHYLMGGYRSLATLLIFGPVVVAVDLLIPAGIKAVLGSSGGMVVQALFYGYSALLVVTVDLALAVFAIMLALRATIYRRLGGALMLGRIGTTLHEGAGGLFGIANEFIRRCWAIVALLLFALVLLFVIPNALETSRLLNEEARSPELVVLPIGARGVAWWRAVIASSINRSFPTLVSLAAAFVAAVTFACFQMHMALGLWMRQFDVAAWEGVFDVPADATKANVAPATLGGVAGGRPMPPNACGAIDEWNGATRALGGSPDDREMGEARRLSLAEWSQARRDLYAHMAIPGTSPVDTETGASRDETVEET